jgi:hypothetical protein
MSIIYRTDLIYLVVGGLFFLFSYGLGVLCQRLMEKRG